MAENSKIEWCTHTANFWIGCTEVSPECDNCYARTADGQCENCGDVLNMAVGV